MSDVTASEGYKQTKLGPIPVTWEVVELQEICKEPISYGIVQCGPHIVGGVPYIRVSDMTRHTLSKEKMLCTDPKIAAKFKRSSVDHNDIVYALRGTIGSVRIVPKDLEGANLTQGTARLSPSERVTSNFLLWLMRSPKVFNQGTLEAKGSTFKEITLGRLRKLKAPLPPLAEQQRIADILTSVDEAIQAREAVLEQTKVVKKGLLQDLLTKGIGHTEFKDSKLGPIPVTWEVKKLHEVCDAKTGLQTGPFGSQLHASEYTEIGIPVLMPRDIVNGVVSEENVSRIPQSLACSTQLNKHRLQLGDIIFGRRGDIGRCALITQGEIGWVCGTGCLRVRFTDIVNPSYMIHYFRTKQAIRWLNENAVGQTMLNLNTTILGNLYVKVPNLAEQTRLASIIFSVDDQIQAHESAIEQLKQTKAGLLQDLLTGKVRVTV